VHLGCLWVFVIGTWLSALFIIVANTWMQDPTGYQIDAASNAQLSDFLAMAARPFVLAAWLHALLAGLITAAIVVFGIAAVHLGRRQHLAAMGRACGRRTGHRDRGRRPAGRDRRLARRHRHRPAADEARRCRGDLGGTGPCAGFSIFAIPSMEERRNLVDIEIRACSPCSPRTPWTARCRG
jgi:hypothetical protein